MSTLIISDIIGNLLLIIGSLFLFSAGLTSTLSAGLLDRVRFSDFVRRREVETAQIGRAHV